MPSCFFLQKRSTSREHGYVELFRAALLSLPLSLPLPFRRLVEESLGQPVDTMFRSFEDQPLGAASIAQVHRVTMKDGRTAVVKVPR